MASSSLLHKTVSVLSLKGSREVHLKKEQDEAIESFLEENDCVGRTVYGFQKNQKQIIHMKTLVIFILFHTENFVLKKRSFLTS